MNTQSTENKIETYYKTRLAPLIGGTITHIITDVVHEEGAYHGFIVTMPDKKEYQVIAMRDPEKNGPGEMDVLDLDLTRR